MADPLARDRQRGRNQAAELLLEHGEYAPLELLIRLGRLGYADYESWRRGDGEPLASRLRGNPKRIAALLQGGEAYCRDRGLKRVLEQWTVWGAPDQPLQLARDTAWVELLGARYQVPASRMQLDLFEDSGATALERDAATALRRGDRETAEQTVARLAEHHPDHARLGAYQRLSAGLHPPEVIDQPAVYLEAVLEELEPAATELLRSGARDFLASHWRALTDALAGHPFDPERPQLHTSYTAARTADWKVVRQVVLEETAWTSQPLLLKRLLESAEHLRARELGFAAAARLCWDHPDWAAGAIAATELLRAEWHGFEDCDSDPPLDVADFPAWCILFRGWRLPELDAGTLTNRPALEVARAAEAVRAARLREGAADETEARRRLRKQQPTLFEHYLASRGRTKEGIY